MALLKDIIIAVPIGIIFNVFVQKLASLILYDIPYEEKYQKTIILLFIAGIVGILIAQTMFSKNARYKNRAMRYGLTFGSALLLIYSLITNWDKMDDSTKLVIMGIIMSGLIWYCYYGDNEKKKKKVKKLKLDDEENKQKDEVE